MKNRIGKNPVLLFSVASTGSVKFCQTNIPSKNVYRKSVNTTEKYKTEDREKYRQFSKSVAEKVKKFKAMKSQNAQLNKLANKNSIKNIANMFDNLINNSE